MKAKNLVKVRKAKILLFDIETMANRAWVWGKYEQNVIAFDLEWYMISFAFKWLGGKQRKARAATLPNYGLYKTEPENDKALCEDLWGLLDEADLVIGHNSDGFDLKKANARFLVHGLKPPTPYKSVDTLKVAKRYFKFTSNRLDDLGDVLRVGRKVQHGGFEMWKGAAFDGNMKDWRRMAKYNAQDVDLLESVYMKLLPWITQHPNLNLLEGTINCCPNCASSDLQKRGYSNTRVSSWRQYQCQNCGAWSKAPKGRIVR